MLGKKIGQNFAINILAMALGILSSIFIARIGGPTILGNISLAMSFQVLVKSIFTHTVDSAHLKVYSEDHHVGLKNFLVVYILYNIITSLLVASFVVWNETSHHHTFTELQINLIIIFILQDYLLTPFYIYITDQTSKLNIVNANMTDFACQTLINIAKIVAVLLAKNEIGIAWFIMGACAISALYPLFKLMRTPFGAYSLGIVKKYLRYSLHISTSTIAYGLLLSFDKVLLGLLAVSPDQIGYYNVGNRLGLLLMTLGVNVGGIFLSVFAKNNTEKQGDKSLEQLSQYERFITISFLPVFMVPVLFGKDLITIVFGSDYIKAYPILIFSLFTAYIKTLTIPYQNFLFANNRFKEYNRSSILFAVAIVVCTLTLGYFNFFKDLTVSVAIGLFIACTVERILFVTKAARVEKGIKFFYYPRIIFFFITLIVGWYVVAEFLPESAHLNYLVRFLILSSIIPLGILFGIYTKNDYYSILKLINKGPLATPINVSNSSS